jgi:hypothetical protein
VLRLAPGLEGAPTANNVMDLKTGLDDGDGSEYHPCKEGVLAFIALEVLRMFCLVCRSDLAFALLGT